MTINRWKRLEIELKKDWWTPSQACHIFAGLIEVERDGQYASIAIEGGDPTDSQKEQVDQLRSIWDGSEHKPREKEHYFNRSREFWAKEYCLRWAEHKRIDIPWFEWAVEQEWIDPLDVTQGYPSHSVTENSNTDANQTAEDKPMGETKEKNLTRLIGILKDIAMAKTGKNQKQLIEYIHAEEIDTSEEALKSKGLGERTLKEIFATANEIIEADKL